MIRPYHPDDIPAILDIWYQATILAHPFLEAAFLAQEKENIQNIYLPNTKSWVYEESGKPIGFISMIDNEIGAIFLYPDYHGQGIGTKLIEFVHSFNKVLEVEVFANNKIGVPFYQNYGFEIMHEHIHEATNHLLYRMRCETKRDILDKLSSLEIDPDSNLQ